MKNGLNALFQAIFWLWNVTFLLAVYAGILPFIGVPLVEDTIAGLIPSEFLVTFVGLIAVPTVCTILGWWRFRKQPLQLIRLFYGVEAPLFLLCLLRMFVLRELTPASTMFLGTVVVCIAAFLVELLYGYAERHRAIAWLQMFCHSLMLLVGVYVGVLLLFYAVPAASVLVAGFFTFQWLEDLWRALAYSPIGVLWWSLIFFFLFSFSTTLFVAIPSALASFYIHSGYRILRAFASQYGEPRTHQGAIAVLIAWTILFISLGQQPQIQAFKLLEKPAQTDSARRELLAKSDVIRPGLVNAYLSSYRYLSTIQENDHIRVMYREVFHLSDLLCELLQNSYNSLMSPFLYNGSPEDSEKAGKLYAQFFDKPIQKAEQAAILHALQSTVNQDDAKAGLLNIGQKKVWLAKQQVTVSPQGDWANVELKEVYQNQTADVEEILYYFSLPESAVLTGVWLGDTDDRAKRFPFTVSPRGAAQKVYNQQVTRFRPQDPALLEQVGPRHYRLRAFPVPPPLTPWERRENMRDRATEMHLWLTYKVMRQENGWAMPKLGEKRNIFWNEKTQRIRNGKVVKGNKDNWLEAFLPADGKYQPKLHEVNLPDGYRIKASPLTEKDYSLPSGKRFAIVLDGSRTMADRTKEVIETFKWLEKHGFADNSFANNDADLYVTADPGTQPKRIDDISKFNLAKMTFYGTIKLKEMLRQFVQLQGDTPYDGILVVTDEGSYELSDNSKDVPQVSAPLWMVHLGGQPPAYDDGTLKAIQNSGGGVSGEVPEVFQRIATLKALGSSAVSVVDGYAWFVEKSANKKAVGALTPRSGNEVKAASLDGFEPLAVRQLILRLSKEMGKDKLAGLDAIHAIAKSFKIVTPYSSMIVLVNDQQREQLKQAEADKNRFDRTVEDGKERLTRPNNPLNVVPNFTSVPEPGTVGGLTAIALFMFVKRKRGIIAGLRK